MSLTFTNILVNLVYYGITLLLFPWLFLLLESAIGIVRHPAIGLRIPSVVLGVAGVALQTWCIILFQTVGRGTPTPAIAPQRLVTVGPYGAIRNPMNVGELMLLLALAGWFSSPFLLGYSLASAVAFHLFVVYVEEPRHQLRFGEEYRRYRAGSGRWLPRFGERSR